MRWIPLFTGVIIACCLTIASAGTFIDTNEGFTVEIPDGWMREPDSVNNGVVTFVQENGDPFSTWMKVSSRNSDSSGFGGTTQDMIEYVKSNLNSLGPSYINAPAYDPQLNMVMARMQTNKGFYVTAVLYRHDGVDTLALLTSRDQSVTAENEDALVSLVKSVGLTESATSPGFDALIVLIGLGIVAITIIPKQRA
jgi:hypothetical protein